MKYIRPLAILTILVGFTCRSMAIASPDAVGPVSMKFVATVSAGENQTVKTNSTSAVTNITLTAKISTTNLTLNNDKLLQMLANSYNTTYPSGASLKLDENLSFVVAVGSNIVQTVTNVLSLTTSNLSVASGTVLTKVKIASSGTTEQMNQSISELSPASLDYNDAAFATADGTTTRFSAKGTETFHFTVSGAASSQKINLLANFSGSGGGIFSNSVTTTDFVVKGSFVGSVSFSEPVGP